MPLKLQGAFVRATVAQFRREIVSFSSPLAFKKICIFLKVYFFLISGPLGKRKGFGSVRTPSKKKYVRYRSSIYN